MRLFILLCLLMPFSAYSYNSLGHIVVAEVAYKTLSDDKQVMLDDLAETIEDEGDNANLFRKFKGVSTYAKSAMLADRVAGERLSDVYERFGAAVPEPLAAYAGETTESWHQSVPMLKNCTNPDGAGVDVPKAIDLLKAAFQSTDDNNSRAVTLVLLTGLVADAHQPIRTLGTDVDRSPEQCEHDNGGRNYCIVVREEGADCPAGKNLRAFWDKKAHGMEDPKKIYQYVRNVTKYSRTIEASELSGDSRSWIENSRSLANEVYNTPIDEWPSRSYERKAKKFSYERMALAASNLGQLINDLQDRPLRQ